MKVFAIGDIHGAYSINTRHVPFCRFWIKGGNPSNQWTGIPVIQGGNRMTKKDYELLIQTTSLGTAAITQAQEENRQKGLPNVYSKDGKIYFQLPDGSITMNPPKGFEDA